MAQSAAYYLNFEFKLNSITTNLMTGFSMARFAANILQL